MTKNMYDKLNYYKILDVSFGASEEEIRRKYRELAKFWHPDHNPDSKAIDMFQKISIAYDVLKDEKSRLKYILLSMIYDEHNFPDMNALCVIRNMHGQEDVNLRAFPLIEITGKGLTHTKIDKIYYCSQYEAAGVISNITRHNWLYGFWGITAFFANFKALLYNMLKVNDSAANLNLLIHNALAYEADGKKEEAATLCILAQDYASEEEKKFILRYLDTLQQPSFLSVKKWNFKKFLYLQLFYPMMFIGAVLLVMCLFYLHIVEQNNLHKTELKQTVVFSNGQKSFSDVAVAKIFEIPVDIYDKQKLYHLKETTQAMHGADREFDVFKTVEKGTTVRVTGYTADNQWVRIMFDNGEMAFVEMSKIEKGIGNEIPLWSKIYKEE